MGATDGEEGRTQARLQTESGSCMWCGLATVTHAAPVISRPAWRHLHDDAAAACPFLWLLSLLHQPASQRHLHMGSRGQRASATLVVQCVLAHACGDDVMGDVGVRARIGLSLHCGALCVENK